MAEKSIFHAYDVRGVWPGELNQEIARKIGWAAGEYLKKESSRATPSFLIGQDARASSPLLSRALIEGLLASGVTVRFGGEMPTPMFYFLVNTLLADAGIMVTASHNPAEYNGFKFIREKSRPIFLGHGLEEIEKLMSQAPLRINAIKLPQREDFLVSYLNFFRKKFSSLFGTMNEEFTIAFDNGNGVTSLVLESLLQDIPWIHAIKLFWNQDPNFPGRGPNPSVPGSLDILSKEILKNDAAFGVAFDADGDRIVFVDENGAEIPGDFVTAWLTEKMLFEHPKSTVVIPIGTSRIVEEIIERSGGTIVFSRRGNVFMRDRLEATGAVFGGERIGHYYFRDFFWSDSALFALFSLLHFWTKDPKPFSEIFAPFKKYASSGELNFEIKEREKVISSIKAVFGPQAERTNEIDGFFADLGDWWFLARASNTEPVLRLSIEAESRESLDRHREELTSLIGGTR